MVSKPRRGLKVFCREGVYGRQFDLFEITIARVPAEGSDSETDIIAKEIVAGDEAAVKLYIERELSGRYFSGTKFAWESETSYSGAFDKKRNATLGYDRAFHLNGRTIEAIVLSG